jgi:hypothetical protein
MPIPVLMPRWTTSEPVLVGKLLRLLVPVSLRWPTRLTWPMTKVTTSQPETDAISRQLRMPARPEPLLLLPPPVPPPPSMLVPLPPLVVPSRLVTAVQQRIMIPPRRLARA